MTIVTTFNTFNLEHCRRAGEACFRPMTTSRYGARPSQTDVGRIQGCSAHTRRAASWTEPRERSAANQASSHARRLARKVTRNERTPADPPDRAFAAEILGPLRGPTIDSREQGGIQTLPDLGGRSRSGSRYEAPAVSLWRLWHHRSGARLAGQMMGLPLRVVDRRRFMLTIHRSPVCRSPGLVSQARSPTGVPAACRRAAHFHLLLVLSAPW